MAALACRRPEKLRFRYRDAQDRTSDRLVEPYRLVYTDRNWYLVAFDRMRDDWRMFRMDRVDELRLTGLRFEPMPDPPDAAALVARGLAIGGYALVTVVRAPLPIDEPAGPARQHRAASARIASPRAIARSRGRGEHPGSHRR
jgi:hypothetical protein